MNSFEYASPARLEDALALLGSRWGEAELLGGGTDLVTSVKQKIVAPKRVVSLKAIPELKWIQVSGHEARIGAMVSLAEAAEIEAMRKHFPSVVHAIESIGSPQILHMSTLGGNLCQRPRCWYYRQGFGLLGQLDGRPLVPEGDNRYHAIFGNEGPAYFVSPSTIAPALVALDAMLTLAAPGGKIRAIKVADFYRIPKSADEREHDLKPNEIVTSVTIPIGGMLNATYKVRQRCGLDWPLVTASVALDDAKGPRQARVVLGHVAPIPWASPKAAAVLQGRPIDAALAEKAGAAAAEGAKPLSRNGYKVQLVKTAVKRAVLAAAGVKEG